MLWRLGWLICLLGLSIPMARADGVGFSVVSVANPPFDDLQVGIWYPTKATASEQDVGLFTQVVAKDAAVSGKSHPLIVMSHGNGGTFESHYDTALALARAGFVVAAMTHTGDNYKDQSQATNLVLRPQAMHSVIDYMLTAWPGHAAIDPGKVGAFGFSIGGFTALVSSGGIPDMARVAPVLRAPAGNLCLQGAGRAPRSRQPTDPRHGLDRRSAHQGRGDRGPSDWLHFHPVRAQERADSHSTLARRR